MLSRAYWVLSSRVWASRGWPSSSYLRWRSLHITRYSAFHGIRPSLFLGRILLGTTGTAAAYVALKFSDAYDWACIKINDAQTLLITSLLDFFDYCDSLWPNHASSLLVILRSIASSLPSPINFFKSRNDSQDPKDQTSYGVAAAASTALMADSEDAELQPGDSGAFHTFIRRMIEVRQLLKVAGHADQLQLPSIVVIGSQSSGKSSVLEAIVGHEFLPKGANMITRRPLELTLVNEPSATSDYAVFPDGRKIHDFARVQQILTQLNEAVPSEQCVSDVPIELVIYSSRVPDLSFVDLPGYIQINSKNQPPNLKAKISALCQKYITERNIILAISAADVDLANSEALRNSREVDPAGERTIGVITKLDLVPANMGFHLVNKNDYPLKLGYVGVVCKKEQDYNGSRIFEKAFFRNFPVSSNTQYGIPSLKQLLLRSLEREMFYTLDSIQEAVSIELDELDYVFKVQYNDEPISVYSYLSSLTLLAKESFQELAESLNRANLRKLIFNEMEDKLLGIYERYLWSDDKASALRNFSETAFCKGELMVPLSFEDSYQKSVAALTMSNLGRTSTAIIQSAITSNLNDFLGKSPFSYHEESVSKLRTGIEAALSSKIISVVSQIENSLKPFKFGTEFSPEEWAVSRDSTISLFNRFIDKNNKMLASIKKEVGSYKLSSVLDLLEEGSKVKPNELEELQLRDPYVYGKAVEACQLKHQTALLKKRLDALHGRPCFLPYSLEDAASKQSSIIKTLWGWLAFWNYTFPSSPVSQSMDSMKKRQNLIVSPQYEFEDAQYHTNMAIIKDPCQYVCPEIYLHLLLVRLLKTATPYLHYELIENFCVHYLPDSLPEYLLPKKDTPVSVNADSMVPWQADMSFLSPVNSEAALQFALQNPQVAAQLRIQERRAVLQSVKEKLHKIKISKESVS